MYRHFLLLTSVTNIAYGVAALVIVLLSPTAPGVVAAGALLYLMFGSAVYHHFMPEYDRSRASLDVSAMYAVCGAFLVYALGAAFQVAANAALALLMTAGAVASAYVLRYRAPGEMRLKIGIFLGATVALILARASYHGHTAEIVPLGIALGLFALALLLRDRYDTPQFPGHALWHVLSAAAFPFLFLAIY